MKDSKHTRERAARRPLMTMLEMRVDARRWEQVRATCRRLCGREVSDADCLMMVTEHYLMNLGLHTR